MEGKKSVGDIIVEKFLKEVEARGSMPWQRPYELFNSFNYFTKTVYRGINRQILPTGEYMTKTQINVYNKENDTNYRFKKGIHWLPVVFFNVGERLITFEEFKKHFPNVDIANADGFKKRGEDGQTYFIKEGKTYKQKSVLRYFDVAERQFFVNEEGEPLPSKIELGEVEIVNSDAMEVINAYVSRSGLTFNRDDRGIPHYSPALDEVGVTPHAKSEDAWFSTAFHELAHSTGSKGRLNRPGVIHSQSELSDEEKAIEECIAEITAGLCCAECGIRDFESSGTSTYENSVAYVSHWSQKIKDWGKDFIYIVSQADKAFNYIMGDDLSGSDDPSKLR